MNDPSGESIGVALTTYNGEQFLARQLDSILSQSLRPDMIVAVDDGSHDGTLKILSTYAQKNPTLKVFQNPSNLGYIKNFAKAIGLCRTDFVALSDQDDIWHPEKLARCVGALQQNPGAGLCYHNTGLMDTGDKHIDLTLWDLSEWHFPLTKKQVQSRVADRRGPVPGFALVMHRELVDLLAPVPGSQYCGHDWWINALAFFLFEPVCIPEPMAYYRMHPGQVSGAADSLLQGTGFEKRKSLFDIERIKRNVKREVYRVFHRKRVLAQKRQDEQTLRRELVQCLEALRRVIRESGWISAGQRTAFLNSLDLELQRLADPETTDRR